jgi:hypothetical protein
MQTAIGCIKPRANAWSLVRIISLLALAALQAQASAAVTVTVQDAQLDRGQTAIIDVFIHSDDPSDLDTLNLFGLELRITPFPPAASALEFTTLVFDPHLTDPDYIFFGNSTAELFPPTGAVSSTVNPNDTYIGGDGTLAGSVIVPATDALLGSYRVVAGPAANVGDRFLISVVPSASTFFLDETFSDLQSTFVPGIVTIAPEPSSICIMSGLAMLALMRRRRSLARA